MKKRIILITILLGLIPALIASYKMIDYYRYEGTSYERNIKIQANMNNIDTELEEKENVMEQVKISNEEKIGILELWKKRLEKIKN